MYSAKARLQRIGPWEINRVHNADTLAALKEVPSESYDCAITSPPYWGQRGDEGIGAEANPMDYVQNVAAVLAETMRCLKSSGLLWLNVGDAYNTPINWRLNDHRYSTLGADRSGLSETNSAYTKNRGNRRAFVAKSIPWAQYGNLLGLPYRIVFALCDKGFLFRGEVIWAKRKAMPEGRCRRPHRKHESIYIFAKNERHRFTVNPPVSTVWDIPADTNSTKHTSTFPVGLPLQCLEASGLDDGALIFDPFMGSGTTAIAARRKGYDFIGFELNRGNTEIANRRIPEETATLPLKIGL